MTIAQLIPLALNVSMGIIVLALALHASVDDALYLVRRPGLLVRSILAMNIVMPVFAAVLVAFIDVAPAVKIAIVALALSPVPPILPGKQEKAGGRASYVIGLLFTAAVLAVVIVPLGVTLLNLAFGLSGEVPVAAVLKPVLITIIAPLIIGIVVRQLAPQFAERIARAVSIAGTVLLVLACIPILFGAWGLIVSMVGNGTLLILAIFTLVGVAVGHLLGGPDAADRTVLALATGTRHPGVALAIAGATFPDEKAVVAIVLWHLVVGAIVSGPYVKWRAAAAEPGEAG
jgi:BASS family bile acid:Na+ symporter